MTDEEKIRQRDQTIKALVQMIDALREHVAIMQECDTSPPSSDSP